MELHNENKNNKWVIRNAGDKISFILSIHIDKNRLSLLNIRIT